MMAAWMLAATLFALLLGVAAAAIERALRTARREARAAWVLALALAVAWPAVAPAASSGVARFARLWNATAPAPLDGAGASIGVIAPALAVARHGWTAYLDVVLAALWLLASCIMLARLVLAMRVLSRVEHSADRDVIAGVPVLVTPSLGPAVFGTRRARVLVPRWLLDLDSPLRELVLRHEQEHCRARDPQLALAVAVALTLVPWNAGAWWISRRLRLAVELDCDARVLRGQENVERYSMLLLFISQRQSLVRLAPMLAESNSHLSRRIAAMNSPRPGRPRARIVGFAVVAVCALAWSTRFAAELTAAPSISTAAFRSAVRPAGPRADDPRADDRSAAAKAAPIADSSVAHKASPRAAPARATAPTRVPTAEPAATPSPAEAASAVSAPPAQGPGTRDVMAVPGSPSPRYPQILKAAGVEGGVLVAFVVDTNGVPDPGSLKILRTTHQLFADAVAAALPNMRFLPAMLNYVKVKQVVRQPIIFNILSSSLASEDGTRAMLERLTSDSPNADFATLGVVVITGVVP